MYRYSVRGVGISVILLPSTYSSFASYSTEPLLAAFNIGLSVGQGV